MKKDKTKETIINSFLMPILSSILVIGAGVLLSVLMVKIDYLYFILACCLFLIIGITIFLGEVYRTNLTHKLEDFEISDNAILKLDRGKENLSTVSNLIKIVDYEEGAKEIWILGYDLSWELGNVELCETVSTNLKKGVKYKYLLPDNPKLRNRAKILLDRVANGETDSNKSGIQIKFQKTRIRLLQFGVCLYDPDINKLPSKSSRQCAVAFFPRYESITSESSQEILILTGSQTTNIQEDFIWIWDNDSNPFS